MKKNKILLQILTSWLFICGVAASPVFADDVAELKTTTSRHDLDIEDLRTKTSDRASRIAAIEEALENLKLEVTNIELTPGPQGIQGEMGATGPQGPQGESGILGLAGKRCPTGLAIVGFDTSGNLICEAPWLVANDNPEPGPVDLVFNCTTNYDQGALELQLLASVQEAFTAEIQGASVYYQGAYYGVTFEPAVLSPLATVSAPLVDLSESEACHDSIHVVINVPEVTISGLYNQVAAYQYKIQGLSIEFHALLSYPDPVSTGSFERTISSFSLVSSQSSSFDFQIDPNGLNADELAALNIVLSEAISTATQEMFDNLSGAIEALSSSIPAPVSVEVTSAP